MGTLTRTASPRSHSGSSNGIGLDPEDSHALRDNDIQTTVPAQLFRLRYMSCAGLIINTMIGTGIFNTPMIIMQGTQSPGITLLLWFIGALYAMSASYLYLELGLNTPRMEVEGVEMGVPRSGGELNYLRYIYERGRKSWLFPTCLFGLAFIIFANMTVNTLAFGQYCYLAAGRPADSQGARGIAFAAATATCMVHALSRRGGIWLSNAFALFKVAMLLMIIVVGFCAYGGVFGPQEVDNLMPNKAFNNVSKGAYGYANAFVEVLFTYAGWNQVNMVLSEVQDPRKTFKRSVPITVAGVSILYMLVNVVYMLIVPVEVQVRENTAEAFFRMTVGRLTNDTQVAVRILNALMAISSFGDIIVLTFTASRVKQELAKEGILPWPRFFGSGYDLSWRRLLKVLRGQHAPPSTLQETPVGSLVLHWFFSVLTILATWPLPLQDAYLLLSGIYGYLIDAILPAAIALGVLFLHCDPRAQWARKIAGFSPTLSAATAAFVAIAALFPIVMQWVPPAGPAASEVPWFGVPTVSWVVLGVAVIYWLGLRCVVPRWGTHQGKVLKVERDPHFSCEDGYPVLDHEVVRMRWVHKQPSSHEDGLNHKRDIN